MRARPRTPRGDGSQPQPKQYGISSRQSGRSDVWEPEVNHLHDSAMPDRAARARAAGLLLLLTPVIWGATFPAAKVALRDVSPWTFVAWSRALGLLAILVVVAVWRPPRAAWTLGLLPAGLLGPPDDRRILLGRSGSTTRRPPTPGSSPSSTSSLLRPAPRSSAAAPPTGSTSRAWRSPSPAWGCSRSATAGCTSAICWSWPAPRRSRATSLPSTCWSSATQPCPSRWRRWRRQRH